MQSLIARNRARMEAELVGGPARKFYSPHLYALTAALEEAVLDHASGAMLDAGCGCQPYRHLLEDRGDVYESLDFRGDPDTLTYAGDIQHMPQVATGHYDTVLCSEVLEHLRQPWKALEEIHRVLAPGGKVILSVPFLSRLHEEPFDFFRYTRHGLAELLTHAGFSSIAISEFGSVFGFLGHQVSTIVVGTTWSVPGIGWAVFWTNAMLNTIPCSLADRVFGSPRMPLGYVAVAERPRSTDSKSTTGQQDN